MDDKFQNKYRIPSARLENYDYGNNGMYFITICTSNKECFFGEIGAGKMLLNELGQLAEKYWLEIPNQFEFIELGDFVVMPNHIHGILIINNTVETQFIAFVKIAESDAINFVSTKGGFAGSKNPQLNNNISKVIRWFKGRCSFEIIKSHSDFGWQTRFYDHVIRNKHSLKTIKYYIQNNPQNWNGEDE